MKSLPQIPRLLALPVGIASLCAVAANAAVVVDFNSAGYVSTNVQLRDTDGSTALPSSFTGRAFNTTGALISNSVSGYAGPTLFGGLANTLNENFTVARVQDAGTTPVGSSATTDYLRVTVSHTTASTAGRLDFLVVAATSDVAFDASSSISFVGARSAGTGHSGTARAVINIDGQYYISSGTALNLTSTYGSFNFGDLTSLTWTSYNPTSSLGYADNGPASITLSGIDHVGLLLSASYNTSASTGNKDIYLGGFTVDATTAIPEPSTYGALLAGLTLAVVTLRRFSRN